MRGEITQRLPGLKKENAGIQIDRAEGHGQGPESQPGQKDTLPYGQVWVGRCQSKANPLPLFGLLRLSLDPGARSVTAQLSRVEVWFGVSLHISCCGGALLSAPAQPKSRIRTIPTPAPPVTPQNSSATTNLLNCLICLDFVRQANGISSDIRVSQEKSC